MAVTVYIDIEVGGKSMSLVAVQSVHGYFELHNWTEFVVVEPDEVIFLSSDSENISSLVVSSHCSCSVYSNVSKQILTQDLTTLDPAVLLSAMQLSLVESLIQEA